MNRYLVIKTLKILEESYPEHCKAGDLIKKLKIKSLDGEISKVIKYLDDTKKIEVVLPESRFSSTGRKKLLNPWLIWDEITIKPDGIDYLTELKKIENNENRNNLSLNSTIVLTQIAIIGIIVTFYEKLNLNFLEDTNIPWFLSAIFWFVLISFFTLLMFNILEILFNKESWRKIFFTDN